MPTTQPLTVCLVDTQGHRTQTEVERQEWNKKDASSKALRFFVGMIIVALLMIPIPIVHFGIPIILLFSPLVAFIVYKVYSGGTDIKGEAKCPACNEALPIRSSCDHWPIHGVCPNCKASYSIEQC